MKNKIVLPSLLLCTFLLFAACGNNGTADSGSGASANQAIPTPTQIVASSGFQAVGEQSILTDTAKLLETTVVTESTAADTTVDLSVGERAYTKNKCGDCHGAGANARKCHQPGRGSRIAVCQRVI